MQWQRREILKIRLKSARKQPLQKTNLPLMRYLPMIAPPKTTYKVIRLILIKWLLWPDAKVRHKYSDTWIPIYSLLNQCKKFRMCGCRKPFQVAFCEDWCVLGSVYLWIQPSHPSFEWILADSHRLGSLITHCDFCTIFHQVLNLIKRCITDDVQVIQSTCHGHHFHLEQKFKTNNTTFCVFSTAQSNTVSYSEVKKIKFCMQNATKNCVYQSL